MWLNEYQNFDQAKQSIASWIEEYNHDRPHRGLHGRTPHDARARFALTLTSNMAQVSSLEGCTTQPSRSSLIMPTMPSSPLCDLDQR